VLCVKYLGLTIGQDLKWKNHVNNFSANKMRICAAISFENIGMDNFCFFSLSLVKKTKNCLWKSCLLTEQIWPPQAILVSDWSISKISSPLKPLSQMNWNLVGRSFYNDCSFRGGPSLDASYQDSVHLAKWFRGEDSFRNWPIRNKKCLWRPCLLTDQDELSNLLGIRLSVVHSIFTF
jgi:hypothetical protein